MNFSLQNYWIFNWGFNQNYKKSMGTLNLSLFFRPKHFSILMQSGVILYFFAVIINLKLTMSDWKNLLIKNKTKIILFVVPLLIFFLTNSDKHYHLLILLPGILVLAIMLPLKEKIVQLSVLLILTLVIFFNTMTFAKNFAKDITKGNAFKMKDAEDIAVIDLLKRDPEIITIYSRPWHHLFTKKNPKIGILPHMIFQKSFFDRIPEKAQEIKNKHNSLIYLKKGEKFIIEKYIRDEPSDIILKLLNKSHIVERIGALYELRIMDMDLVGET